MEFFAATMEQVVRFEEIAWQSILSALNVEGLDVLAKIELPNKYLCDVIPDTNTTALLQMDATLGMSSALQSAVSSTHRILDSFSFNSSWNVMADKLERVWHPICEELGCDHTNFMDAWHANMKTLLCVGLMWQLVSL